MKQKLLLKTMLLLCTLVVGSGSVWADTYEQLTSIANIDESAEYVLGVDGTGFHYSGTSSWGLTALPSNQTPLYYTLKKAADGKSFTAKTTISSTTYYLQVPTSNTFGMATSTGTNTDLIIGTTQVSGTNYAVANKTTTTRHLRINGTSGLRSYAGTTGTMAFFYKVVGVSKPEISPIHGTTFTGTLSVTITQSQSNDIYYTIDGTTPTSSSTKYTGAFNVSASPVTGEVTVKAIAVDGDNKSSVVSATYTDTSIQPTLISLTTNYSFLGVASGNNLTAKFTKTVKGVGITIDKTSGTWARGDDSYIRIYANNFLKVEAPDGYNVKQVVFTSPGTWGAEPTVGGVAITSKTWTGEAESVQFDFSATNYISAVEITLVRALPYVVSFGDINDDALEVGDDGTFSTTITPAIGSLEEDTDYEIAWASSNDAGLTVLADGSFEAVTRGAYTVTATATALDDETYRDATKEYDVTVTEQVEVDAEDVVMALGDDPVTITVVTTDGYAGTLNYESGNTSVATVDASGNVTAVAKGTTTITISSPADASHYFTAGDDVVINVTVKGQAGLAYAVTSYKVAYGASFPTPALTNPHDLAVTYSKTGDNVATVDPSTGAVTILSGTKGTARITASFAGNAEYAPGSAYYDIKVYDPDGGDGTLAKPFSIEEANEWIAENLASDETSAENYYVRGIVSSLAVNGKDITNGKQYFFVSDDGTETDEIGIYYAKYLSNVAFSLTTWVMPGDEVVVYGPLQNYDGNQPYYVETGDNTYVASITRKTFSDSNLPVTESFASSFGSFTNDGTTVRKNESSSTYNVWTIDTSNNYAKATSYVTSTNTNAESMLISGMIDGSNAVNLKLSFDQCRNKYFDIIANEAMVYAKEDGGSWTKQTISSYPSTGSNTWSSFETATVDLSAFDGKKFQIAFVYKGTSTTAGTWEIKNVIVNSEEVLVTVGATGYATYCSPYPLDFSATDVKAYVAASDGSKVTLTEIEDGIVPANAGVVLYCETANTYSIPVTASDATDYAGLTNELIGITTRTKVAYDGEGSKKNYILANEAAGIGFYKANATGAYLPANRAYLSTENVSTARYMGFELDDETTGISTMHNSQCIMHNDVFDLQGRKIAQPKKGLYIKNGKKVFVK